MTDEARKFLSRWSRLKAQERAVRESPAPAEAKAVEPAPEEEAPEEAGQSDRPALPAIEDLTADSDYTGFLDGEVPPEMHQAALRKLWRSDPKLANLDGLNDYDADFRTTAKPVVQTAYKVGQGFADSIRQAKAQMEAKAAAAKQQEGTAHPNAGPAEGTDRENG